MLTFLKYLVCLLFFWQAGRSAGILDSCSLRSPPPNGFMEFHPKYMEINIKSKTQVDSYVDVWSCCLQNFLLSDTLSRNSCHLYLSELLSLSFQISEIAKLCFKSLLAVCPEHISWQKVKMLIGLTWLASFFYGTQIYTKCCPMSRKCCVVYFM